jgi:hypothetical protein
MKKILRFSMIFAVAALSILAADPSGKWAASMPGRGGNPMNITFNLKADGDKLTGTVSSMRGDTDISDGKVDGDKIMFSVVREFNGNQMKQNYTGTLDGDTIHFSVVREGGNANGPAGSGGARTFDAKKQ